MKNNHWFQFPIHILQMKSVWLTIGKVSILSFNPHTDLKCMDFGHLNYWNLLECILCQLNPHTSTDSVQSKSFRSRYLLPNPNLRTEKEGAKTRAKLVRQLEDGVCCCVVTLLVAKIILNLADLLVKEFVTLIQIWRICLSRNLLR